MINKCTLCPMFAFLFLAAATAAAEKPDKPAPPDRTVSPTVAETPLADILESVSKKSGRKFAVDYRVQRGVATGQLRPKDITYSSLLVILRNNDLAGVTVNEVTNIVPVRTIRQYPLPVLFEDDPSIDGEEWVTRVIQLKNAPAVQMVPIMRPLLPQAGHLAANPSSNTILIVDRYANVRRVTEMIARMDSLTPSQAGE